MSEVQRFFQELFDTGRWPPRWHCGKWSEFHGWLYILSDVAIWAAYFTIPFLLIHFIIRKKDIPFPKVFWLFGAFILACGLTHLVDALIFWVPIYNFSALLRFVTAIVSWATIFLLYRVLPDAFSLKTPAELERLVNERTLELHASMEKTKFLADAMPQIVWYARPDGNLEYINAVGERYAGKSREAVLGFQWTEMIHPNDRQIHLESWRKSVNNASDFEMESRLRNAEGEYFWHLTRAVAHRDENGQILMWVGTATDIEFHKRAAELLERMVQQRTDELAQVNAELVQSNNDLEYFAAVASHDLQAPLRTINNYLGFISEKNHDVLDERSKHYISRTIEAGGRMKNLIENLLAYSQVNAEKANFEQIELADVLLDAIANMEDIIERRNTQVTFGALDSAFVDPVQIARLFQNLILNAINYNESEIPAINIQSEKRGDEIVVSVTDNGTGIAEENLSRIFDVFTRLQSETPGTGLGLTNSRKIVDKHGGRIWVESKKGEGTTFFFSLPAGVKY